jgi:uncharacterized repeat protein (TIGR03943 family)
MKQLPLFILGLWGVVFLKCWADGRLNILLHSIFHWLIFATGIALILLALVGLRWLPQTGKKCSYWSIILLIITGLALILFPPRPSFSTLAANRSNIELGDSELSFFSAPEQRSLTDWVRLINSYPDPELYAGDPVLVSGFVLATPAGPPEIARLLVRCCLADATPVGLPVSWPKNQPWPKPDQWLQIKGVMAVESHHGALRAVLIAKKIKQIKAPIRPLEP